MSWFNNIKIRLLDGIRLKNTDTTFIESAIWDFEHSPKRKFMDVAEDYYNNKPDILKEKRWVIGRDAENNPVLQESKVLSNNHLTHNFLRKLARQKISYLVAKPFSLTNVKADDAQAEEFFKAINPYLGDEFYRKIKMVSKDSIIKGIGWFYVYYNENGDLCIKRVPPEEVIPFWSDADHTELDAVVRHYYVTEYSGGTKTLVHHVEYYDKDGVEYYLYGKGTSVDEPLYGSNDMYSTGGLVRDKSKPNKLSYINLTNGKGEEKGYTWNKLPWIPFKYGSDEESLLTSIKSLIDNYNRVTSDIANDVEDMPNSVTVIKNYDGNSKEEFIANKNQYRTIFVQGDGDASKLDTNLNIVDIDAHLNRLRQDIYEFGQGVDATNKDIRDTSGVALRFIYSDLDMDCSDWSCELEWAIKRLFWFIQQDIVAKGGKNFVGTEYKIVFNTDVIINETETITNCFNSMGVVSHRTVAANHPFTIDVDKEMDELYADQKEELQLNAQFATKPDSSNQARRSDGTTVNSSGGHKSNGQASK